MSSSDPSVDNLVPSGPPPLIAGATIDLGPVGVLEVGAVTVRNWSRVARCELRTPTGDMLDVFVKQWIDRVGRPHRSGYAGDRACVQELPDELAPGVFVLRAIDYDDTHLIAIYPHVELATLDVASGHIDLPVVVAARIGRALADIIVSRRLPDDASLTAVWKGLDPKNVGLDAEGRLHVFDFGPPSVLPVADAAARTMSAGLLSQWRAALGSHLLRPSDDLLRALCAPLVGLTDFERVKQSLDDQARLRRSEPQRRGLAASAVRLGLATAGRRHWAVVEAVARQLFEHPDSASLDHPSVSGRVSVVLLNWNSGSLGADAARSVLDQEWADTELIVVDNASVDDSLEQIRAAAPSAVVLEMTTNTGFGRGMNAGIAVSTGEFILPLNCDARLDPGYVSTAVKALDRHRRAAAVGGKVLSPRVGATGPLRITTVMRTAAGDLDTPGRVDKVNGACPVFRRAALAQVQRSFGGPYDPTYGMYGEDVDLALTLRRLGWDYRYEPDAVAHHVRSYGSAPRLADRRGPLRRSTLANRHRNIERHGQWPLLVHLVAAGQDVAFGALRWVRGDRTAVADVVGAWRDAAQARQLDRAKRERLAPKALRARFVSGSTPDPSTTMVEAIFHQLGQIPAAGGAVVRENHASTLGTTLLMMRPDLVASGGDTGLVIVELEPDPSVASAAVSAAITDVTRYVVAAAPAVSTAAPTASWRSAFAETGLRVLHLDRVDGSGERDSGVVALLEVAPRGRATDPQA